MSEEESEQIGTPRINASMFPAMIGKTVRIVGKYEGQFSEDGSEGIIITTSDGKKVNVIQDPGDSAPTNQYIEVLGNVINENSIQEVFLVDFGDSFDLGLYDQCVKLINGPFKSLFM
ncbi:Replication protein A 14 kDa subunit [Monocercomonoides exilis]|uniref:Replication protein A 14 kDa subunit n=1 Tax=Monocercomonoides exilis TaxID=2049356 RepID=UPI00355A9254|nr:Replication protein A 14 kDa subunit [Monocercomonoides exilis]|eukprot:MONOS_10026.1-p1 / transcript=MONOS_10026.1 / gene=MONOS_10026 / organism=Monocercomonoides_exilis_PA203 / gene_product=Replication protein A 14 kDa subunit / transcript_product=Replication protein A 14 kDa subunit / location=Mono_scaffold00438:11438-11854(-) / protein_length=117 / sequence_SO=supercontig / SO=protein_coding / is_pseudo=false